MQLSCSGVILAGGLNSRFSGEPKALLSVRGRPILDHISDLFGELFSETVLVTNDPLKYLAWDLAIITDLFPVRSSLTGIHAGLFHSPTPYVFIAACDTPFLKKEMVRTIVQCITPGIDVVIPRTANGFEPLCAVYGKRCLKIIERQLANRELKTQNFFKHVRIHEIDESMLRQCDPDLLSFYNINTPADLARVEKSQEKAIHESSDID